MPDAPQNPPASPPSPAQPGVWVDPYPAYNFRLLLGGAEEGYFTECGELEISVQPIPYRPGGMGPVVHQIPGPVRYSSVELRYGLTSSTAMWDWVMAAASGRVQRQDVSIAVLDRNGIDEAVRWNLYGAWPCKWRGSALNAMGRAVAIESITLVFERMERA